MERFYTAERGQQIVISLLKSHNIRKIVASPGATNITLVASMQQDPYFEIYSSVDERSAAYIACGLAAESGEPVVLSCTGATASRNYMPGLTEAYYRHLPVLAITANQGRMKIGHYVAQNIDRSNVPNDVANLSVYVSNITSKDDEWNCEILVNKALLALRHHGGGPVHIDLATTYSKDYSVKELPSARVIRRYMPSDNMPSLDGKKVAINVGAHCTFTESETKAIDNFCASHNAVVFCDHSSGYYGKYKVLGNSIYIQNVNTVDVLIHIGDVSGNYSFGVYAEEVWRVSEDGELRDTFRKLTNVFEMSEQSFFTHYSTGKKGHDSYLKECKEGYKKGYAKLPELPFSNPWIAKTIANELPNDSILHLSILNTLRSWDFFEINSTVQGYCNTGGFGIDGIVSTLVGASLANKNKLHFGIVGDLAFFYDMNVCGNRHLGNNVRIMLINNGRGTEFTNYNHPGAAFGEKADDYIAAAGHYGNKSPLLIKHYAEDLGFEYLTASNKVEFEKVYKRFLTSEMTDKPMLFEIFTDSKDESDAIEALNHVTVDAKAMMKSKAASAIRGIFGEKGIDTVKNILGK